MHKLSKVSKEARWVIFIIVLILSVVTALSAKHYSTNSVIDTGQERLQAIPSIIGERVTQDLTSDRDRLQAIAAEEQIASLSPEECGEKLKTELAQSDESIFSSYSRVNDQGVVDCSTLENYIGTTIEDIDFLKQIFEQGDYQTVLGPVTYSDNEADYFVSVHVPLVVNDELQGTLGSRILLADLRSQLLFEYPINSAQQVVLVSHGGSVVFNNISASDNGSNIKEDVVVNEAATEAIRELIDEKPTEAGIITFEEGAGLAYEPIAIFGDNYWYAFSGFTRNIALTEGLNARPLLRWVELPLFGTALAITIVAGVPAYLLLIKGDEFTKARDDE